MTIAVSMGHTVRNTVKNIGDAEPNPSYATRSALASPFFLFVKINEALLC
jgi:hypothetical protein